MKNQPGSLYLLTGLILGIAIGLVYSWAVRPANAVDTAPFNLQIADKEQYRALIATAFAASGDLVRAKARLELLGDTDPFPLVLEQAHRMALQGETGEVTALRLLAAALLDDQSPP